MTAPLVTVLMPAYNAARFIGSAIRSVLSQTFTDFELLIIDDRSTDDTEKEIRHFTDPRIRLFSNSQNLGLAKTLNAGIEKAHGKYIARLDADDLSYPTRLSDQINILERQADVGLVAGWTEIIDEHGHTKGFGNWRLSPEDIYYVLHFRQCLTHSSVMFRTQLARDLGGYSEEAVRTEDFDLWWRMSKLQRIVQLPAVLVKWREHRTSITGTGLQEMERNAFRLAAKHLQQITGELLPSEIVEALIECRSVRKLEPEFLIAFPAHLKKVQEAIVRAAPDIYDEGRLRAYVDIEAAKYAYIFRSFDKSFELDVSARAKLLGFAYYLTRYHGLPLISGLVPKSHF